MIQHKQEMIPIGSLVGADYNPRSMPVGEMDRLVASLRRYGLVQPIVARAADRLIIGGHQRVAAMREMLTQDGAPPNVIDSVKVPVVLVDKLDDAETKALNLALNKISGEWDYEKLGELLGSLDADLPTGFTDQEIADITSLMAMPPMRAEEPVPELDVAAQLAEQARKLTFKLESDADLAVVNAALKAHGMTGPGNAAEALVKLCSAVAKVG